MPNLMYYNAYSNNFGDEISPIVSEHCLMKNEPSSLLPMTPVNMNSNKWKNIWNSNDTNVSAIGSIFHHLPDKCTLWGTGCVKRYCNKKKVTWDVQRFCRWCCK